MKEQTSLSFKYSSNENFFPDQSRPQSFKWDPKNGIVTDGFEFLFHYPGQFLISRAHGLGKWNWAKLNENVSSNVVMAFTIRNIDVLKLRNKTNKICLGNFFEHDAMVMNQIVQEAECRPPHFTTGNLFPLCRTMHNMSHVFAPSIDDMMTQFDPPCTSISKIQFEFEDILDGIASQGLIKVRMNMMDRTFKQIEQLAAYNFESFVGNVGGYLGLFLGYALAEVPTTIFVLCVGMKNWMFWCLNKKNIVRPNTSVISKRNICSLVRELLDKEMENYMVHIKASLATKIDNLEERIQILENLRNDSKNA